MLAYPEQKVRRAFARNRHAAPEQHGRLVHDPDPDVRKRVATRADLDPPLLAELAQDRDNAVRTRALLHPLPRTWPQRAAIDQVFGHTTENPVSVKPRQPIRAFLSTCSQLC